MLLLEKQGEDDSKQEGKLPSSQTECKLTNFKSPTEYRGNVCRFEFTNNALEAILRRSYLFSML